MHVETENKASINYMFGEELVSQSANEDTIIKNAKKMKYLVADTAAFIKNVPMQEYADEIISTEDVVNEIRDKETKQRLLACPLDIQYREPDSQSIKIGKYSYISNKFNYRHRL